MFVFGLRWWEWYIRLRVVITLGFWRNGRLWRYVLFLWSICRRWERNLRLGVIVSFVWLRCNVLLWRWNVLRLFRWERYLWLRIRISALRLLWNYFRLWWTWWWWEWNIRLGIVISLGLRWRWERYRWRWIGVSIRKRHFRLWVIVSSLLWKEVVAQVL